MDARIWEEERKLFRLLEWFHEKSSGSCTEAISLWELEASTAIADFTGMLRHYGGLFRGVNRLERRGYLLRMWESPLFCITPKGIHYIERRAGRRRSLRLGEEFPGPGPRRD